MIRSIFAILATTIVILSCSTNDSDLQFPEFKGEFPPPLNNYPVEIDSIVNYQLFNHYQDSLYEIQGQNVIHSMMYSEKKSKWIVDESDYVVQLKVVHRGKKDVWEIHLFQAKKWLISVIKKNEKRLY